MNYSLTNEYAWQSYRLLPSNQAMWLGTNAEGEIVRLYCTDPPKTKASIRKKIAEKIRIEE